MHNWRKSSHSDASNTCVEVAVLTATEWRKSTRSSDSNTCVEVAHVGPAVAVRDSKHPTGPILTLSAASFARLLRTV
jgi:hypothetical protein